MTTLLLQCTIPLLAFNLERRNFGRREIVSAKKPEIARHFVGEMSVDNNPPVARRIAAQTSQRAQGIDAFRCIAFVAVVVLHVMPFNRTGAWAVLDTICRFAVPFFFVASGYFLYPPRAGLIVSTLRLFKRLAPPFIFWLVVYSVLTHQLSQLAEPAVLARYAITGGPAFHLWFLPALGMSILFIVLIRPFGIFPIAIVGIFLFVTALAFGPYREALGLPQPPMNPRNGFWLGTFFVAAGYCMASCDRVPTLAASVALFCAGLSIQLAECYLLAGSLTPIGDFSAGTALTGIGAFGIAFRAKWLSGSGHLSQFGRLTLWMYCIHAAIIQLLPSFDRNSYFEVLLATSVVVVISAVTALAAARVPALRNLAS